MNLKKYVGVNLAWHYFFCVEETIAKLLIGVIVI